MKRLFLVFGFLAVSAMAAAPQCPMDVDVCFTPHANCRGWLLKHIYNAKQSIYVQSYTFTSTPIAKALVRMHKKGVDVKVIMDSSQFECKHFSQRAYLIKHGIPVWEDDKVRIAHNKVMIIDKEWVETGSYNYTYSALKKNAENMLFIHNPKIVSRYLANWQSRQRQSKLITNTKCVPEPKKQSPTA